MFKKIYPFFLTTFLCGFSPLFAQTYDDFTDGNLSVNLTWVGDDSLFKVNASGQLQALVSVRTERSLATQIDTGADMEWQCWMRMAYNPSSQNNVRWYLLTNTTNLSAQTQGYYVQLGGSTGNTDSISLYKQDALKRTCLVAGRAGTLGKTNNTFLVKVHKSTDGIWQLYTDTSAKGNYFLEGSVQDSFPLGGNYSGFYVKSTVGNSGNFYADDFVAGRYVKDTLAPVLKQVEVLNTRALRLLFSEPIKDCKLQWPLGFEPDSMWIQGHEVRIQFTPLLPCDTLLKVPLIAHDISGNLLTQDWMYFVHLPLAEELLLSELMFDPDPPVLLPNKEYLEVYNNSKYEVDLNLLMIQDATSSLRLPNYALAPSAFVIICAQADTTLFKTYGAFVGVEKFIGLNNTGEWVLLQRIDSLPIHGINYAPDWHDNPLKINGGYSLEMRNAGEVCMGKKNWGSSGAAAGGSPGQANIPWHIQAGNHYPIMLSVDALNDTSLLLQFSEDIYQPTPAAFEVNGQAPAQVFFDSVWAQQIILTIHKPLQAKDTFWVTCTAVKNCLGNSAQQSLSKVYYPILPATWAEVLITEVYEDSRQKGSFPEAEFVELYNRSEHAVSLLGYRLCDAAACYLLPTYTLLPQQYVVLCKQEAVKDYAAMGAAVGLTAFPSLGLSDCLTLRDSSGYLMYSMCYESKDFESTSLPYSCSIELVDTLHFCHSKSWQASIAPVGATPGKANSRYKQLADKESPFISRLYMPQAHTIELVFNKAIDSSKVFGSNQIKVKGAEGIERIHLLHPNLEEWCIHYRPNSDSLSTYAIEIDSLWDCSGQVSLAQKSLDFQTPRKPLPGEVIVNEILFNPSATGCDFIELLNTSNATLNLQELYLYAQDGFQRTQETRLNQRAHVLFPHEHLAICENKQALLTAHPTTDATHIIENALPSLPDDGGILVMVNQENLSFDSIVYTDDMHVSFLNNKEEVSLEKINPFLDATGGTNFTSASEREGFATAGKQNSMYAIQAFDEAFKLQEEWFSPNGDGLHDQAIFEWTNRHAQAVAYLQVYDHLGELVKDICAPCLVGSEGIFYWNGDTLRGNKAAPGIYLVQWRVFTEAGKQAQKRVCVTLLAR